MDDNANLDFLELFKYVKNDGQKKNNGKNDDDNQVKPLFQKPIDKQFRNYKIPPGAYQVLHQGASYLRGLDWSYSTGGKKNGNGQFSGGNNGKKDGFVQSNQKQDGESQLGGGNNDKKDGFGSSNGEYKGESQLGGGNNDKKDGFGSSNGQHYPDWNMQIQLQIALLLGSPGVGKSTIFKNFPQNEQSNQNMEFPYATDWRNGFILFDSPSFEMNSSINGQNRILNSFKYFLNKSWQSISTFFLIIKYERLDLMKRNFYLVMEYFWNFTNNIVILITFWDEKEHLAIKIDIVTFFQDNNIQKILFIEKDNTSVAIQEKLRSGLTDKKGINLQNTLFQIEEKQVQEGFFSKIGSFVTSVLKKKSIQKK